MKWSEGLGTVAEPCYSNGDYYAQHGVLTACSVTLSDIFDQIDTWANLPGHQQEILLVGLSIDNNGGGGTQGLVLTQDCQALGTALGSALLTPSDLEAAGYSADPGQVTLGQLWAMPGHPRVIVSDDTCMNLAGQGGGLWNPDPPFGSGAGQSFYANQCYAAPYDEWAGLEQIGMPGIESQVKSAAEIRAYQGGGDDWFPGNAEQPGPVMQGGLYTLFVQATPTWACTFSLAGFDAAADRQVLAALYPDWWQNVPLFHANVNIIAGDFVEDTDLVKDTLAMDESYPEVPGAITPAGADQVKVPLSAGGVPASAFAARVTDYTGVALPGAQVAYQISGPAAYMGFGPKRAKTVTVTSDAQGDINPGDSLRLDELNGLTGTWTVTATGAGGTHTTWTLNVVPDTGVQLEALAAGDTVPVGRSYDIRWPCCVPEGAFAVHAKDAQGNLVAGVQVTFNLGSAGTFSNGSNTVTVPTSGAGFTGLPAAVAPAFTATTSAGKFSISISAPGADNTLSLPFTVTPGPPVFFQETQGQGGVRSDQHEVLDRVERPVDGPIRQRDTRAAGACQPIAAPGVRRDVVKWAEHRRRYAGRRRRHHRTGPDRRQHRVERLGLGQRPGGSRQQPMGRLGPTGDAGTAREARGHQRWPAADRCAQVLRARPDRQGHRRPRSPDRRGSGVLQRHLRKGDLPAGEPAPRGGGRDRRCSGAPEARQPTAQWRHRGDQRPRGRDRAGAHGRAQRGADRSDRFRRRVA